MCRSPVSFHDREKSEWRNLLWAPSTLWWIHQTLRLTYHQRTFPFPRWRFYAPLSFPLPSCNFLLFRLFDSNKTSSIPSGILVDITFWFHFVMESSHHRWEKGSRSFSCKSELPSSLDFYRSLRSWWQSISCGRDLLDERSRNKCTKTVVLKSLVEHVHKLASRPLQPIYFLMNVHETSVPRQSYVLKSLVRTSTVRARKLASHPLRPIYFGVIRMSYCRPYALFVVLLLSINQYWHSSSWISIF
jgi:hypothetical protein